MALNKDIEDQFSSAVKTALDTSEPAAPPSEAIAVPAHASRPRRHRAWAVALLCLAFVAIAAIVFIIILQVRGVSVPFLSDGMATIWPGDSADKLDAVPAPSANATTAASANSTGAARASATPAALASATPDVSARASEPTAAVESTAAIRTWRPPRPPRRASTAMCDNRSPCRRRRRAVGKARGIHRRPRMHPRSPQRIQGIGPRWPRSLLRVACQYRPASAGGSDSRGGGRRFGASSEG